MGLNTNIMQNYINPILITCSVLFMLFTTKLEGQEVVQDIIDNKLIDASYETMEMSQIKNNMTIPFQRTESILILDNDKIISTELFEVNFNTGKYEESKIHIIKDVSKIREFTNNHLIVVVIKID